ncbi:unnamed protein product [Musa acuminata subsp. malaccensis]|uniref:(wild Malaysian banana) hypothetical protein n=1 Tax=Musa acuminata subsp. malaccensis TaxID=214687 RepID=A0A804I2I3_MUSAM|nr:unnamed protein product [Musa acuminata subsp. malaccensis]
MAFSLRHPSSLLVFIALLGFLSLFRPCACSSRNFLNTSAVVLGTSPAEATWYGNAHGAGSEGNVSNIPVLLATAPFSSTTAAGGPLLYKSGKGCGACYQVSCTSNAACPGGPCASGAVHFDLSGSAFGAMSKPGQEDTLRAAGAIQVQYSTLPCSYPGVNVAFKVDAGSNANYRAVLIIN